MEKSGNISTHSQLSFVKRVKKKLLHWLRITNDPVVKVYHGYANATSIFIFGHVFKLSPLPRKKYRQNFWTNSFALLRSFIVRVQRDVLVRLTWNGKIYEVKSAADGFFRFEINTGEILTPGIHEVVVDWINRVNGQDSICTSSKGTFLMPPPAKYTCISDIDDTFLISHSSNLRKRLYVLFTKNAHSRKPFEGVVSHYRLLSKAGSKTSEPNPFFYVSSSEWNLRDLILEFATKNSLPRGIYLLNQLKRISQLLKTGQNNHATKFMRIARIMEAFPDQQFVLLGDDSQQDPYIYASVVEHFPGRIISIYLRHVYERNVDAVKEVIKKIESKNIPCCHFISSAEAIEHSFNIGLLTLK